MTDETTTTCGTDCQTTQAQAISYMNNETLWAMIIVEAWQNNALFCELRALAQSGASANAFLQKFYEDNKGRGAPQPHFTPGVDTRIVIDTPNLVHLIMPAVENIPARAVDMVPHAF